MEKAAEFFSMGKTAAPMLPQVQSFLEKLKPHPNKIYPLINALGAGEFWGSNINGDYFPESSLIHKGMDWGYETFYNAFPYKHHVNKDPTKSFGKVELACWNDAMKRVELVVSVDRELAKRFGAEDVVDKLDQGLFPDVSMGCKVPYDLCSVCLDWKKYRKAQSTFDPIRHRTVGAAVLAYHRRDSIRGLSVTRNDYCEHLKGMLNKILSDGKKVYAINDYPRFFDISFVFIGADKTAKVMAKLAAADPSYRSSVAVPSWFVAESLGYDQPTTEKSFEKVASASLVTGGEPMNKQASLESVRAKLREKKASHRKGAEIIKEVVPSQFGQKAVPLETSGPDLPKEVLDQLGGCGLSEGLSTPTTMGMLLRPKEFQRITIISMGKKPMADELDRRGEVFGPSSDSDRSVPLGADHFSSHLKRLLLPFLENRSSFDPIVKRRVIRVSIRKPEHEEPEHEEISDEPLLSKISAAYNGYLDRFMDCVERSEEVINQHADLWETVHGAGVGDAFYKTAAGSKINPWVVVGGVGAGVMASEYAKFKRRQAMMGQGHTGSFTDIVADNPKLMAALGGMGALHQQGSEFPRRVVSGIYHGIKGALGRGG
jgi:hypothetical protein